VLFRSKKTRPAPLQSGTPRKVPDHGKPGVPRPGALLPPRGVTSTIRGDSRPRSGKIILGVRHPTPTVRGVRKVIYDPSLVSNRRRPGGRPKASRRCVDIVHSRDGGRINKEPQGILPPTEPRRRPSPEEPPTPAPVLELATIPWLYRILRHEFPRGDDHQGTST